jgi:hypothetical protein
LESQSVRRLVDVTADGCGPPSPAHENRAGYGEISPQRLRRGGGHTGPNDHEDHKDHFVTFVIFVIAAVGPSRRGSA